MKILRWISDNILFLIVAFLLVFIPLYPKRPLLDIVNTWVYIRAEDFVVVAVILVWLALLFRKKISFKTPLTMPILLFWIVGALSTIHGVLLIFPEVANTFPNVAFLSMLRRIEYIVLFFVGFAAIKDKRVIPYIVAILAITLICVFLYGLGQKYLGFPAYLTMNEEFAKGDPIQLSALSRVPSTFAGHYDLAAYLVLVIPIMASMIFGFRNWLVKILLGMTAAAGLILLFMTVSRVSFFVLFIALGVVLFFHKKRWVIFSVPIVALVCSLLFFNFAPSLMERFGSTVKEVDVLVNAENGEVLGNIKKVSEEELSSKVIKEWNFQAGTGLEAQVTNMERAELASPSANVDTELLFLPGILYVPPNASTGESLPQGTGYINLSLSPVREQFSEFFYEPKYEDSATRSADLLMFSGNFLIKRAAAYDLSFTTRYQGEWPNAIEAFKRNIFLGSGYSSITLAMDNSYLRMLGEVGFLGFAAFISIFIAAAIYIKKGLRNVDSPVARSFIIGFSAGVIGLALNATLIDVFEASKVAFYLWLLMGVTLGILSLYQTGNFGLSNHFKKVATSSYAIVFYLGAVILLTISPMINGFFIGDDFTWLRWAAECVNGTQCPTFGERIFQYFTQADGFFYRPGTKTFFLLMYSAFWLNPVVYHIVSLLVHFIVVVLVFLLAKKILQDFRLAVLAAFLFALLSGYSEAIFWLSSIGHLFSVMFVLLSLLLFTYWDEKKRIIYFILSVLSIWAGLLFHELAVVAPLLLLLYKFTSDESLVHHLKHKKIYYIVLFASVGLYLLVRAFANTHWSGGDYSYNLLKLPFNFAGNLIGYAMLTFIGPMSLSVYETLRNIFRDNLLFAGIAMVLLILGVLFILRQLKRFNTKERKILIFGIGFVIIALLPFIGLGNITSRYTYMVSFGFIILFVFFIKKLYQSLLSSGREIAMGTIALFISIFVLLHVIQVQQIQNDWSEAGLKVKRFFVSVEGLYQDHWSTEPVRLHLVNAPIRTGEAWVFPVGIDDALWFAFKNPKIKIYHWQSSKEALNAAYDPILDQVLVFDEQGNATEMPVYKKFNEK